MKDMETEGLDLRVDGDFLYAQGTTLGGDDGIAIAYALALLEDETLRHPRLEVVITVGEEVGMDGAREIDLSMLKGHKLINLDSEEEGIALAGCAGGGSATISYPITRSSAGGLQATLHVDGLCGGHSGVEIHKGHPNATHLLAAVLSAALEDCELSLVQLRGGTKDNAIPRSASAELMVDPADQEKLIRVVEMQYQILYTEYGVQDPDLEIRISFGKESETEAVSCAQTKQIVGLIMALPNGVQKMSSRIEGLTETSLNLGITLLEEDRLKLGYSCRSSVGAAYASLIAKVRRISGCFGASLEMAGEYPAWEYAAESSLRERLLDTYRELFDRQMKIDVIHAGVECGLLADKIDHLDAVSIGPDILDIHTPKERLSISSTERCYRLVRTMIENS